MKLNQYVASAALMALTLSACGDDGPVNNVVPEQPGNEQPATPEEPEQPTFSEVSGEVEGIWTKGSTIQVKGHLVVPAGKSLTIEEGVQVIFDEQGVGANHVPIEFTVDGNL